MAERPSAVIQFRKKHKTDITLPELQSYVDKNCAPPYGYVSPFRAVREYFGLPEAFIAEHLNISSELYSDYERGREVPPSEQIISLCRYYTQIGEKISPEHFTLPPSIFHFGSDFVAADPEIMKACLYFVRKPNENSIARRHALLLLASQFDRAVEFLESTYHIPGCRRTGNIIKNAALHQIKSLGDEIYIYACEGEMIEISQEENAETVDVTELAYDDLMKRPDAKELLLDAIKNYHDLVLDMQEDTEEQIETIETAINETYKPFLAAAKRFASDAHKFSCLNDFRLSVGQLSDHLSKSQLYEHPFIWAEENGIKIKRTKKSEQAAKDLIDACLTYIGMRKTLDMLEKNFNTTDRILEQIQEWEDGVDYDVDTALGCGASLEEIVAFICNYEWLGGRLTYEQVRNDFENEKDLENMETPSKTRFAKPGKLASYPAHRKDGGKEPPGFPPYPY